jgi:hypothetical protein
MNLDREFQALIFFSHARPCASRHRAHLLPATTPVTHGYRNLTLEDGAEKDASFSKQSAAMTKGHILRTAACAAP